MRIPIREQLALLILVSSLIGLAVLSIATWVTSRQFILGVCKARLSLTASLKAAQLASNLDLMQTTAVLVSSRVILQYALQQYDEFRNTSTATWQLAKDDLAAVLDSENSPGQELLLQSVVFTRNGTGPDGPYAVLNVTSQTSSDSVELPWACPGGEKARLGMSPSQCGGLNYGYPPSLYPNLTYTTSTVNGMMNVQHARYNGVTLGPGAQSALLLGPFPVNETLALVSMTVPIANNTDPYNVLGWLSVVMNAALLRDVLSSTQGLQQTGETLLVGPVNSTNLFANGVLYNSNHGRPPKDFLVQYVLPLQLSDSDRHQGHTVDSSNPPFWVDQYPAVQKALTQSTGEPSNTGAVVSTKNEEGMSVAVGHAMVSTSWVDWLIVVEQAKSEVWGPINYLRDLILACVFGTAGFMALIAFPLAHFSVLPIRRLSAATAKSVEPPASFASRSSLDSLASRPHDEELDNVYVENGTNGAPKELDEKDAGRNVMTKWMLKKQREREFRRENRRKRAFRIPAKVEDRKHVVQDELSDLTRTFNEMSDELMAQYTRLEERVQQRTAELELSKKAAEAANESKTLFIANISHELKTPLNGIMGMTAVCMQEDDPVRIKRSLGTIYKSGDILLNLLTDLLTFSKNQVGQQLSLDEKEFRLGDVSSQILAVFDKQAKEGQIDLRVVWEGVQSPILHDSSVPERTDYGPHGTGRLKDMVLWGDLQRILQVIINLVSNALKFTPKGGSVVLTIRCLPDLVDLSRRTSRASRQSPSRNSRTSRHPSARLHGSDSDMALRFDTANAINARDRPNAMHSASHDRAPSPPPGIGLAFEFEVKDTGPGIHESLQQKIFEPFVQGDLRLTKKFGGTGLGLSICSQLCSLMRGGIDVSSTVGVGSTFTMKIPLRHLKSRCSSTSSSIDLAVETAVSRRPSLADSIGIQSRHSRLVTDEVVVEAATVGPQSPAKKVTNDPQPRLVGLSQPFFASSKPMEAAESQTAAMQKMTAEVKRSGNRVRVLVAEDNHINQEVVLRMLKLEDIYDVTVAKDGQEALDFVKQSMAPPVPGQTNECKPFNLIFMDVQMPNVDGLQSTRLIREIGYQAPIVALTAFAEESNIRDCMDSGMNYFLSKPIKRPQLKKVLKDYCTPIPEENEEPSPTHEAGKATASASVSASAEPAQAQSTPMSTPTPTPDAPSETPQSRPVTKVDVLAAEDSRGRSESPVSPFSKA